MNRKTVGPLAALLLVGAGLLLLTRGPAGPHSPPAMVRTPSPSPPPASTSPGPEPVALAPVDRSRDVFGVVVDAADEPVAGALLELFTDPEGAGPSTGLFTSGDFSGRIAGPSARSGPDGSFLLAFASGRTAHLRASAGGFLETLLSPVRSGERVTVVLCRPGAGATLRVSVRTDEGAAVARAGTSALAWRDGRLAAARRGATGPDGVVTLEGLPGGTARVFVSHPDFPETAFEAVLPESGVRCEAVVLALGPSAGGRVVDAASGLPVGGARVRLGLPPREQVTGDDGRFSFPNHTRDLDALTVTAPGYAQRSSFIPYGEEVEIRLTPAVLVRGRLVDESGAPLPGGKVRARGFVTGDRLERTTSFDVTAGSGEDGVFVLDGLRDGGLYTLSAEAPGRGRILFEFMPEWLAGTEDEKDAGDLVLPAGRTVRGVLLDSAGTPEPGTWVRLAFPDGLPTPIGAARTVATMRPQAFERCRTDDLGRFEFAGVAPGAHGLETEGGSAIPARVRIVIEPSADPADVVLRRPAGRSFVVRVVDPEGRPVAGAHVVAKFLGDGCHATTDADGRAGFEGLPEDVLDLVVDVRPAAGPGDFALMRTEWTVALASGGITIPLRRAAYIEGRCVDPEGRPLPGAGVRVQTAGGELAGISGIADREGRFKLLCAEGGLVNLCFVASAIMPAAANICGDRTFRAVHMLVRAPQRDMRVVLEPVRTDCTLDLTVLDPDGRPLAGAAVRAEGAAVSAEGETDRDGRVHLAGVEGGVVFVYVTPVPGTVPPLTPVPHFTVIDVLAPTHTVVRMRRGRTLTGVVRGPDGAPVAGATVHGGRSIERLDARAETDADGRFSLAIPEQEGWFVTTHWTDPDGVLYVARADTPPGAREVVLTLGRGER
ncbi:MAG: carboxypeptidase-like regulatory domain-containing protein [Planctomycetes bacterium]|jgi:protocatechuate 3,4-dioxygenase beta subunit|nr:carboxypeptidase-like regulatory domain-containing protein [Planctomycetota bacterium]